MSKALECEQNSDSRSSLEEKSEVHEEEDADEDEEEIDRVYLDELNRIFSDGFKWKEVCPIVQKTLDNLEYIMEEALTNEKKVSILNEILHNFLFIFAFLSNQIKIRLSILSPQQRELDLMKRIRFGRKNCMETIHWIRRTLIYSEQKWKSPSKLSQTFRIS